MNQTKTPAKLHCSKLPRFFDCASSVIAAVNPYEPPRMVADLGHAVHLAMAEIVEGKDPDLDTIAERFNCDRTELSVLVAYGRRAWRELAPYFPMPRTEVSIESALVKGTADVLQHDGDTCVVLDWKSGRVRRNALNQVVGYGHAAAESFGDVRSGKITTIVVWLQFGEYETRNLDREYLDQWASVFNAQRKAIGRQYGPGDACTYCPRQMECDARSAFIRASCVSLAEVKHKGDLTAADVGRLWDQSRLVKKALEYFEQCARALAANGGIDLPDGRRLVLQDRKRYEIDPMAGWPVMKNHGFTDREIANVLSVKKAAIEETAKEKARARIAEIKAKGEKPPRGMIGAAAKSIIDDLKSADAVKERHFDVLDTVKAK